MRILIHFFSIRCFWCFLFFIVSDAVQAVKKDDPLREEDPVNIENTCMGFFSMAMSNIDISEYKDSIEAVCFFILDGADIQKKIVKERVAQEVFCITLFQMCDFFYNQHGFYPLTDYIHKGALSGNTDITIADYMMQQEKPHRYLKLLKEWFGLTLTEKEKKLFDEIAEKLQQSRTDKRQFIDILAQMVFDCMVLKAEKMVRAEMVTPDEKLNVKQRVFNLCNGLLYKLAKSGSSLGMGVWALMSQVGMVAMEDTRCTEEGDKMVAIGDGQNQQKAHFYNENNGQPRAGQILFLEEGSNIDVKWGSSEPGKIDIKGGGANGYTCIPTDPYGRVFMPIPCPVNNSGGSCYKATKYFLKGELCSGIKKEEACNADREFMVLALPIITAVAGGLAGSFGKICLTRICSRKAEQAQQITSNLSPLVERSVERSAGSNGGGNTENIYHMIPEVQPLSQPLAEREDDILGNGHVYQEIDNPQPPSANPAAVLVNEYQNNKLRKVDSTRGTCFYNQKKALEEAEERELYLIMKDINGVALGGVD